MWRRVRSDRHEVFELVRDQLADILEIEPGSISESSSFAEDLDADSLALIELVEAPRGGAGRAHGRLPHRGRGSRGPPHRPRRRRLRGRQAGNGLRRATNPPVWAAPAVARRAPAAPRRFRARRHGTGASTPTPGGRRPAAALTALDGAGSGGSSATTACSSRPCRTGRGAPRPGARPSNERLEFLGDAVLGLVVAEHCYRAYPEHARRRPGQGAGRRGQHRRAGRGGRRARPRRRAAARPGRGRLGGRAKASILANAVEAVIGAVYLDGGWEAASRFVLDLLDDRIGRPRPGPGAEDFKTRLQEVVLRRVGELPRYEVRGDGPDHARRYRPACSWPAPSVGEGEGRSKKDAEQAAARVAWARARRRRRPTTAPGRRRERRRRAERRVRGSA